MILSIEEGPWRESYVFTNKITISAELKEFASLREKLLFTIKLEETIYNPGRTLLKYKAPPAFSCEINTTFTPKCLEMSHHEMQFLI